MSKDKVSGNRIPTFADQDRAGKVKKNYGTYIGIVKNNADATRGGRLQVFIPEFGGKETESSHWITVGCASPYMGAARQQKVRTDPSHSNEYLKVNHSYGMWFTPPDIGNHVLVTFVSGDINDGYWFACIMPDLSQHAIPAAGGSEYLEEPKDPNLKEALKAPPYPCVEFNEENDKLRPGWTDFLKIPKPVHEGHVYRLLEQGLEDDKVRGVISSSSQRESPSQVFGISTPGREGPNIDPITQAVTSRTGGHTFVMDDGDQSGKDKLIRLRTSGGHQILMNDEQKVLYIGNATGNIWMEFTGEGKLYLFGEDDISIRTKKNINLHADNDINMFAFNNINMFAGQTINQEAENINLRATTRLTEYGLSVGISSGSTLNMSASTEGTFASGTELVFASGVIFLNEKEAPTVQPPSPLPVTEFPDVKTTMDSPYYKWRPTGKVSSTVPIVPTHEPYETAHPQSSAGLALKVTLNDNVAPNPAAIATSVQSTATVAATTPTALTPSDPGPMAAADKGVKNPAALIDLAEQPLSKNGIGTLAPIEVAALKAQISKTMSGGNYTAENPITSAIGKYQMTPDSLINQNYLVSGTNVANISDPTSWTGKDGLTNINAFKSAPALQEKIMDVELQSNFDALTAKGIITSASLSSDISGKLSVAHSLGIDGCADWVKGNGGVSTTGLSGDLLYNQGRYAAIVLAKSELPSSQLSVAQVSTILNGRIT